MHSGPLSIEVMDGSHANQIILRLAGPLVLDNLFDFQKLWRAQTAHSSTAPTEGGCATKRIVLYLIYEGLRRFWFSSSRS